jgi:hypothetical protein
MLKEAFYRRELRGTNLWLTGFGYDINGNWTVKLKDFDGSRGYSFQTLGAMPETHRRSKWVSGKVQDLTDEDLQIIAKEVIEKIGYIGSKRQKEKLWTSETDPLRRESSKKYSADNEYLIGNLTYQDFEDAWHSLDKDGVLESFNEEERGIADRSLIDIVDASYDIEEELYVPTSENELYIVVVEDGDILVAGYSIDACHIFMPLDIWQETVNELRSKEARAKKSYNKINKSDQIKNKRNFIEWEKHKKLMQQAEKEKKEVEPVKEARRRYSEDSGSGDTISIDNLYYLAMRDIGLPNNNPKFDIFISMNNFGYISKAFKQISDDQFIQIAEILGAQPIAFNDSYDKNAHRRYRR